MMRKERIGCEHIKYHKQNKFYSMNTSPKYKLQMINIGILRMTGEVTDRFDGRTLFYLDKKQFIELQNL